MRNHDEAVSRSRTVAAQPAAVAAAYPEPYRENMPLTPTQASVLRHIADRTTTFRATIAKAIYGVDSPASREAIRAELGTLHRLRLIEKLSDAYTVRYRCTIAGRTLAAELTPR